MEFFVGIYRFKIEGEHENGGIDDDPKSAKIICGSAAGAMPSRWKKKAKRKLIK